MKRDAISFDEIARTVFAPVYPVIADQIIARTKVTHGCCLDIGCGSGYLGAALARKTDLDVCFFDLSAEMLALTDRTIAENGLAMRARTLQGDVGAIQLPDASVNLCISRGSIFFWEALAPAFSEIYRVLAPGGWAYIGGGFGSLELKTAIVEEMTRRNRGSDDFRKRVSGSLAPETRTKYETAMKQAGIASFSILQSEAQGLWIIFRKPTPEEIRPDAIPSRACGDRP